MHAAMQKIRIKHERAPLKAGNGRIRSLLTHVPRAPRDPDAPLSPPSPQPPTATSSSSSFSRVPNALSMSAAQSAHFGSVRRAWRPLLAKLGAVPQLQRLALEAASFFTTPREIDFHLPRDFHAKYETAELLGEGAFGKVHRVRAKQTRADGSVSNLDLELDLAVKIIPKIRIVNLTDYQALQQEGRMMVLLGGTLNVVHFFGAYEDDEHVYLVMEHCVGGDAFARLTQQQPQQQQQSQKSEALAAMYMADILHVVWQCHLLKILHGDLKLENFLFADHKITSPLKLTDFGGASFLNANAENESDTASELLYDVRGTPLYTAPEVLHPSKPGYSFPSDMWSCGVILYRLLAGRFPFDGPLLDEKILHEEIDFDSAPWPQISPQAKDLVQRLLTRDVRGRLTAKQALQHPWIARPHTETFPLPATSTAAPHPPLNGTMVQRLQLYRSLNSFQQTAFTEIAKRLPLETKEELVVLFSELSRHGSSKVGLFEFSLYLESAGYKLTQGEVKSFLAQLDLNGDGLLSLDEFCAALLDWSVIQRASPSRWRLLVHEVFSSLDRNQDGKLCIEDLAVLAPFSATTTTVKSQQRSSHSFRSDLRRCFQHADLDGDGVLDQDEFHAMLHLQLCAYEHYAQRLR